MCSSVFLFSNDDFANVANEVYVKYLLIKDVQTIIMTKFKSHSESNNGFFEFITILFKGGNLNRLRIS